ncbi:GNS1/SUR4 family-domain-containing protein [Radiomyces spectabilis]|uniref:GNS1/SUR4 family-domain-containing protein n=1 Tax=Radiomyces spectabilis TaxID=64574 RepID=UPI002220A6DD|nr:GNS1/SUR4 family-domain-containing protein [Radiomyces spectabilis]KAI8367471.1 GNS1/SUR4 family-domain-containing protein [Radiomyces spectabilis]
MDKLHFSPETPFGIALYPYFEKVYEAVVGKPASSFSFTPGVTPLSTVNEVVASCITYFVVIFGGRYLMTQFPPFRLQALFQLHNFLLTIVSGILLVLMVEQIFPKIYHHGFLYAVCSNDAWTQPLELLYYLNYLVKYWELIDTVFLVAKKKKLEFLHYYHHSLTMVLCFSQLGGKTAVSWVPITLNLTVHVLMYYYYFRTAAGHKIWWKKYLTTMQITQFIIDLFVIYFCTYTYFAYTYWPHLPNMGSCAGTEASALFGCALLSSYLFLFINFYRLTYQKSKAILKQRAQEAKSSAPVKKSKKI